MFVAVSFIGVLPEYSIDCIFQIRAFFDEDIYAIINDLQSPYIAKLTEYGVKIVPYQKPTGFDFHQRKFMYLPGLVGREQLFLRSFERFFLLYDLMNTLSLTDGFFLEIDNLIYDDPRNWLTEFQNKPLAYMYDNEDRFSSGIFYAKNALYLRPLLNTIANYITNTNGFLTEMNALHLHYMQNPDSVQVLPTHWPTRSVDIPEIAYQNFGKYRSIFDAAAIGVFLCGMDPFHTGSVIKTGLHNNASKINYTRYQYVWSRDDKGRNRPYVRVGNHLILINNLHAHSKNLRPYLSL